MNNGLSKLTKLVCILSVIPMATMILGCQAASLMNSRIDSSMVNSKLHGCNRLASVGYYRLDDETSVARLKRDFADCIKYAKTLEEQGILIKQVDSINSRFSYIR